MMAQRACPTRYVFLHPEEIALVQLKVGELRKQQSFYIYLLLLPFQISGSQNSKAVIFNLFLILYTTKFYIFMMYSLIFVTGLQRHVPTFTFLTQNSFILSTQIALLQPILAPTTKPYSFRSLCFSFAPSRMSYKWSHTLCVQGMF